MENQIAAPGQGFHILTDCLKDEAKLAGCVQIIAGLRKALNRTIGAISLAFFSKTRVFLNVLTLKNKHFLILPSSFSIHWQNFGLFDRILVYLLVV